jgi:hypothetical protein
VGTDEMIGSDKVRPFAPCLPTFGRGTPPIPLLYHLNAGSALRAADYALYYTTQTPTGRRRGAD